MKEKNDFFGFNTVFWMGIVEDRNDPIKLARVRVRIFGWHEQDVPASDLPWAQITHPANSSVTGGVGVSGTGLREGDWVVGIFLDGELARQPLILGSIAGVEPSTGLPSTPAFSVNDSDAEQPKAFIDAKDEARATGVETAIEELWDEPESTYAAEYPKNHSYVTESGHVFEVDDTPGAERIHNYHRTGTFEEIDAEGNKITRIVGDKYSVTAGTDYVYVKGNVNLTIDQDCTTYIKGNWDIKVDKDVNITVGGNMTEVVEGDVSETYNGNQTIEVAKNVSETIGENVSSDVSGDVSETFGGNQTTNVSGNVDIDATNVFIN